MTIGAFFEPNYFRPLVRIGEDVPVDSTKELIGYPVNATQQQCQWRLYQSKKLNPTTIDGETPLGSLTIDVPQTGNVSDREMRAQFSFGEAEIGVTVEFPKQGLRHVVGNYSLWLLNGCTIHDTRYNTGYTIHDTMPIASQTHRTKYDMRTRRQRFVRQQTAQFGASVGATSM
eukprot:gene36220-43058_t